MDPTTKEAIYSHVGKALSFWLDGDVMRCALHLRAAWSHLPECEV
jgi:hypothetical protein